jgi:PHD/YefM family antitoxin component YafN of YafNO toxin-antitoxin module
MRNIKLIFAIFIVLNVVSCADGRQPVAVDANNQGDGALLTEDDFIGEVEMMLLLNACGRKAEAVREALNNAIA